MLEPRRWDCKVVEFLDPVPCYNANKYHRFVGALWGTGLIRAVEEPIERVGLFMVWHMVGECQKLIIDARRSNMRFRPAPGVSLLSLEGSV